MYVYILVQYLVEYMLGTVQYLVISYKLFVRYSIVFD